MTARQELDSFLAKYSGEIAALTRTAFAWMRRRFPAATVLVYDNYNALVMGFASSERASDAVFSLVAYPRWVNLFFLNGATLADPKKLLKGAGKQVRSISFRTMGELKHPDVIALIEAEARRSGLEQLAGTRGPIIIRSVSAKQRARTPK